MTKRKERARSPLSSVEFNIMNNYPTLYNSVPASCGTPLPCVDSEAGGHGPRATSEPIISSSPVPDNFKARLLCGCGVILDGPYRGWKIHDGDCPRHDAFTCLSCMAMSQRPVSVA